MFPVYSTNEKHSKWPGYETYLEAIKYNGLSYSGLKLDESFNLDEDDRFEMSYCLFKVYDKYGDRYALSCFDFQPPISNKRYHLIEKEIAKVKCPYFVNFKFIEDRLWVNIDEQREYIKYPFMLYEWVDGESLDKYIQRHRNDTEKLIDLYNNVCKMATYFRSQPFAHGDISSRHIMVQPSGSLKLIHYDNCFFPDFYVLDSCEVTKLAYLHPFHSNNQYNSHIDDYAFATLILGIKLSIIDQSFKLSDYEMEIGKSMVNFNESDIYKTISRHFDDAEVYKLYILLMTAYASFDLRAFPEDIFNPEATI